MVQMKVEKRGRRAVLKVFRFISHMVQMKVPDDILGETLSLFLYIPHGSDESSF